MKIKNGSQMDQEIVWTQCKLVLRRVYQSAHNPGLINQSYENMEAQVDIEDEDIPQPFLPKFIFSKRIPFIRRSFLWSLRRQLPQFKVKMQKSYFQKMKEDDDIIDLFSELTAAYVAQRQSHFYLQQVKIMGQKRKKFNESGYVAFSNLKFSCSSFRRQKKKFCLIVTICARCVQEEKLIIKSYLCSEILVCPYSRRKLKYSNNMKRLQNSSMQHGSTKNELNLTEVNLIESVSPT